MKVVKLLFIACLVCVCSVGFSAKFSQTGGGVSTVGTGGDYATLKEASRDFNYAPSWTSDWTLLILSDLTENENVAFGRPGGTTYKVTIKPNTGVTPTINFNQTADNTGFSGHLLIGLMFTTSTATADLYSMHYFTIDGSNAGTNSKDLTLQNSTGSVTNAYIIRVVGNSDNVTIKNCIIKDRTSSTSAYAVVITTRNDGTTDFVPDNNKISNCTIECTGGQANEGIRTNNSGTLTSGVAQTGLVIEDCLITARHRGIFLNQTADAIIRRNTVRIIQTSSGMDSYAIWHNGCNGATGWTMNIYSNIIDQLQTANATAGAYGVTGICAAGAATSGAPPTYNIYNNMICGFNFTAGTDIDMNYRGIRVGSNNCNTNIYYNSIYMPDFPNVLPSTANERTSAIAVSGSGFTGTANIRNNMIYMGQQSGIGIHKENTTGFNSDYNNIYVAANAYYGRYNNTDYATLSNWQTGTGKDANSDDEDPTVAHAPYSGKWTSTTNLHFDAQPGPIPGWATGIPISGITFDIDGDTRGTNYPMKGCDDSPSLPVTLDMVVVE